MKEITKAQIEMGRSILKRGVDILVASHQNSKKLKDSELELLDGLSNLTVDMDKYLEDMIEYELVSGLQYLYDAQFKGDEDFIPTNEEARKILGL